MNTEVIERPAPAARPVSLVAKMAARFNVEPGKLVATLKATCFKTERPVSDEQLMALLVVADQYNLNPFTRELFAFLDAKSGGIVPVVSVDGWSRIVNEHPQCDGFEERMADDGSWAECTIYRKDRSHHLTHREWRSECQRNTAPWNQSPRRMLGHRAFIQTARKTFGFGFMDEDEAARVIHMGKADEVTADAAARAAGLRNAIAGGPPPTPEPPEPMQEPLTPPPPHKPPSRAEAEPPGDPFDPEVPDPAELVAGIQRATSVEGAQLFVDQARGLAYDERALVEAAFAAKWVPPGVVK